MVAHRPCGARELLHRALGRLPDQFGRGERPHLGGFRDGRRVVGVVRRRLTEPADDRVVLSRRDRPGQQRVAERCVPRAALVVAVRGGERLSEPDVLGRVGACGAREVLDQGDGGAVSAHLGEAAMARLAGRAGGCDAGCCDPQRLAPARERGGRRDHGDDLVVTEPRDRARYGDGFDVIADQGTQRVELCLQVGEE
ncbi:hypothetical protein [Microbacterium sp.]|uniref:hypothetical protein n=1 Tax=Microbacterium sp. TaxID=51671 RepID=UPI0039E51C76